MTTAAEQPAAAGTPAALWVNMYRQMMAIRLFEEQVNDI